MCECGCGEVFPYDVVEIEGKVLVVEVYRGCENCDTGLMVSLHLATPEYAREWEWEPTRTFDEVSPGYGQINIPLLSPEDLLSAAKEMDADNAFGQDGYESLTEYLETEGRELLAKALEIRARKVKADLAAHDHSDAE